MNFIISKTRRIVNEMKLIDVRFEEIVKGDKKESPKSVKIVFLFSNNEETHITRLPIWLNTKSDNHFFVIQKLHNLVYDIINGEIK